MGWRARWSCGNYHMAFLSYLYENSLPWSLLCGDGSWISKR